MFSDTEPQALPLSTAQLKLMSPCLPFEKAMLYNEYVCIILMKGITIIDQKCPVVFAALPVHLIDRHGRLLDLAWAVLHDPSDSQIKKVRNGQQSMVRLMRKSAGQAVPA